MTCVNAIQSAFTCSLVINLISTCLNIKQWNRCLMIVLCSLDVNPAHDWFNNAGILFNKPGIGFMNELGSAYGLNMYRPWELIWCTKMQNDVWDLQYSSHWACFTLHTFHLTCNHESQQGISYVFTYAIFSRFSFTWLHLVASIIHPLFDDLDGHRSEMMKNDVIMTQDVNGAHLIDLSMFVRNILL